jgi:hypothetical protein
MRKRASNNPALTPSSQVLFRELSREYGIHDRGGREILRSGLHALDQAEAAEKVIMHDGQTTVDRFGQRRVHPLLCVARDFRSQWLQALRMLNLSVGDPPKVGRPPEGP